MATTAILGHRGSPDPENGLRENTLDAFERARLLGADGVELDVRSTADGAMAVHHDPVIPGIGAVGELGAADLPAFVPTLPEVLGACRGMTVNVEIKNLPWEPGFDPGERLAGQVTDLVVSTGWASDVVVSSFWLPTLAAVRRASPGVATGLLVASRFDPAEATGSAVDSGLGALHPHIDLVSAPLMDRAHRAGLAVAAWAVNHREQLERAKALAVDTVITDDVASALAILGPG